MKPDGKLLTIPEFKGMSTNPPRGTVLAPELLLNAHLDRQGGYTPMFARSRRVTNVTRTAYAARGDNLFLEQSGTVNYWDVQSGTFTAVSGAASLANAVTLMPDLLLTPAGLIQKSGAPAAPAAPTGKVTQYIITPLPGGLDPDINYEILLEFIPIPGSNYSGTLVYSDPGAAETSPYGLSFLWTYTEQPPIIRAYIRQPSGAPRDRFVYAGSNIDAAGKVTQGVKFLTATTAQSQGRTWEVSPSLKDDLIFAVTGSTVATYHRGRVFLAGVDVQYKKIVDEVAPVATTEAERSRVYFSDIIANATATSLPAFSLLNFIDVPFRVSRRIVALASVGPYLYIFGDRELLILTGDPATDGAIESVGDSIGAVSASSVQQLSGTVFWQSDSGVLAVTGAQVREVGGEVRDMLMQLGLGVSTTVDFRREQYVITDGTTMLSYHAREGGWTQRQIESGGTPSLIYGGGTPYMQQGGNLYSIGGEAGLDGSPSRLTMRIRWPRYELGDWLHRKTFSGIAFGMDLATSSAYLTNLSTVDASTQLESDATLTVTPGNRGVKLHTVDEAGINLTGVTISVEVTMDTGDSRGIMRPPLVVYGDLTSDEDWSDNGI